MHRSRRELIWFRRALLPVLVLTACGSSDDSAPGSTADSPDASIADGAGASDPSDTSPDGNDGASTEDASDDTLGGDTSQEGGAPEDAGDICTGGPYRYSYFLKDDELHWIAPHGTGVLATGVLPSQVVDFSEATVDGAGHASGRSTTKVYVASGRLFRVDGSSPCQTPPPPQQIATLTDVAQLCRSYVVSDLADRTHSRLIFQYGTPSDAAVCGGVSRPSWSIPLEGNAATAPTSLVEGVVPAISPMGTVDAALSADGNGVIARLTSLTDATIAKTLVPADLARGSLINLTATWIGDGRYLITAFRINKNETELYVYNAITDIASPVRGFFSAAFALKPMIRDATYLYFTAAPFGGQQGIYRLARDGSAAAQLLAGSTSDKAFAVDVVGVVNGALYFTQPGTTGVDVWSHPTSIDFAAPPAAISIVKTVGTTLMLSSNHLFYRPNANFVSVIGLDGTNPATYQTGGSTPLATWLGCSAEVDSIDPVGATLCGRVIALVVDNSVAPWANHVISFDATAGGDVSTSLFTSTMRGEQQLGSYAGYSNLAATLQNSVADPFFRISFDAADMLANPARAGIASSPNLASATNFQILLGPAGVSYAWLK